jgi:hypothetical protein
MPVPDPGVDFFIGFHDLIPNPQQKCIYFVKEDRPDRRCMCICSDNERAIELHRKITKSESGKIVLDDIREYISSNCCSRARHRDLILSSPLLILLVERWLDEILSQKHLEEASRYSAQSPAPTTPKRVSRVDRPAPSSCDTSTSSATSRATTVETPLSSPSYSRCNSPKASIVSSVPLRLDASPTPLPRVSSTITPITKPFESEPAETQKRYNLRPGAVNDSFTQWAKQTRLSLSAEFYPHINEPTSEDTVAWRFCEDLDERHPRRDFRTGSVYIYSRKSSPGYVKIGWTSVSVDGRLEKWSECGYTPIELFRVTGVPYAQRVETLTHYELIKEWRREQPCKGCWIKKHEQVRHQEWFEVSQERAIQVVSTWAELFKKSNPYERNGSLKTEWKNIVDAMKVSGGAITSKRLLEHYQATLAKDKVLAKKAAIVKEVSVRKEVVIAAVVEELPKSSFPSTSDGHTLFSSCRVHQRKRKPLISPASELIGASAGLKALKEAKTISSQSELLPLDGSIARITQIESEG